MLAIDDVLQNRYRVVRQLGHGGMGTVYEAHDERFEISVALKEVLIDLAKIADPNQQQMVARAFEREAKTLALLHHEAFPHVIDYFSERDHQYLIMELIRGEDLGEQLQKRKKPFEFEEVLDWTWQLLDALDYLHTQENPIIHRDLKPQNMKLTTRGKVKILDFGIAKGADNKSSSTITNQTFVAATLNYSPIEQLLRVLDPTFREFISQRHKEKVEDILEHNADARSDLYSLGATLYQLLTATQPHDTLKRALDLWAGKPDPLPNPMTLNPRIPPYFNSILLKSLEIDRDNRFVSAAEMQHAVRQFMENENRLPGQIRHTGRLNDQAAPGVGMQTQIRLAEEQKFLDDLASPTSAKTEVLPPLNQLPTQPPTPSPFTPPINADEDRRRIAEQQKFLAELDSPPPAYPAPKSPQDSFGVSGGQQQLTDYGRISPSVEQTNYAVHSNPASSGVDQTQVSYLDGVLPAQPSRPPVADATIINRQIGSEAATAAVSPGFASQNVESKTSSKAVWIIPAIGLGAILLVSVLGIGAYFILSSSGTKTNDKNTKVSTTSNTTPSANPDAGNVKSNSSSPDTATAPVITETKDKPDTTPIEERKPDSGATQKRETTEPKRSVDTRAASPEIKLPPKQSGGAKTTVKPPKPSSGGGGGGCKSIDCL